jgi:acetyl esterase/lipase
MSDGEFISLGHYESQDVMLIVEYLRKQKETSLIGLWGRSMGAVSTLMHADKDPGLACIVLDSPFCSLNELAVDLAKSRANVPTFIIDLVLSIMKSTIRDKAGFSIDDLNPLKNNVSQSYSPAFFLSAEEDELIKPDHAKRLHDAYLG